MHYGLFALVRIKVALDKVYKVASARFGLNQHAFNGAPAARGPGPRTRPNLPFRAANPTIRQRRGRAPFASPWEDLGTIPGALDI